MNTAESTSWPATGPARVWSPSPVIEWLILEAWQIEDIPTLVRALAERLLADGVPLWRLFCLVPTLHPRYVGSAYRWRRNSPDIDQNYGDRGLSQRPAFTLNPMKIVMLDGYAAVRRRLDHGYRRGEFPLLDELQDEGATDYVCMAVTFMNGQRSAVSFTSDHPHGFSAADLLQFDNLLPVLARLIEREMLRSTAINLLDTYVGHNAGARILKGQITRGAGETLYAAIWFCDLRGFSRLSETLPPEAVIAGLDAYFEAMAGAVQRHGGEVLKFIGDAMLAIFPVDGGGTAGAACGRAIDAAAEADAAMVALNRARAEAGVPALNYGLALHLGEVVYGNIGAADRLDFTVIGAAVNLANRIERLCKTLDRRPLLSRALAEACGRPVEPLGTHILEGLAAPQEIFAPAPGGAAAGEGT